MKPEATAGTSRQQLSLHAVHLVPGEHDQAPHAHVDGKVGAHELQHGHRGREGHVRPVPARHEVPRDVGGHREREEAD
jgi:hypothetical protein